jgi:hypothetical protein
MEQLLSNTSLADFIYAAAIVLHADRPDIWENMDDAIEGITGAFTEATSLDEDEQCMIHFYGYTLTKSFRDSILDYTLSKKLVSFAADEDGESDTFDWTVHSVLYSGVDTELPPNEELDIEPNIIDDLNYEDEE